MPAMKRDVAASKWRSFRPWAHCIMDTKRSFRKQASEQRSSQFPCLSIRPNSAPTKISHVIHGTWTATYERVWKQELEAYLLRRQMKCIRLEMKRGFVSAHWQASYADRTDQVTSKVSPRSWQNC